MSLEWIYIFGEPLKRKEYQAVSESLPLKKQIFASFSRTLRPDTILASNTSSISITKIAAATIPEGESAASKAGKEATARVVGQFKHIPPRLASSQMQIIRTPFLQPGARNGQLNGYLRNFSDPFMTNPFGRNSSS